MDNESELMLTDLIDVETLQQIQDAFSNMSGMAALTADINGVAVTKGSNFTDFCFKYTRTSEIGKKRCEQCDINGAKLCIEKGSACSYHCHAGLVDYAAPIIVNNELIGSFIGGQVLVEPPDLNKFRKIAEEIGADPDDFVDAVKKINVVSQRQVDLAAQSLSVIANALSTIAYKGYQLKQKNIEVEKATHMKSDFLANMSHEIRTPMNAVIGLSELALREEMSPPARDYLHQIKASSKNLLVIINDILDFSKIESGKMEIVNVEYEPLSIFNDLTGVVNTRIGKKDIEFTMDISPDLPKMLYGDNIRIHQIVLNLLTNAVKFTHSGEVHLKIDFEYKDDETILLKAEIRDTGSGIKEEDMSKLFNSFQQLDSKRNRNIEGTGLGLAISQQLLSLMGGRIWLESEYNKGSTFSFEVPQKVVVSTPILPKLDKKYKVSVLMENKYVKAQLIRDLNRIGAEVVDLVTSGSFVDLNIDFFIVGKPFSNPAVQEFIKSRPEMQCIAIVEYDSLSVIDIPNVRAISKPVYSLSLYNAMGIKGINLESGNSENESFSFIAPEVHILIVDDNTVNLTVATGLLEPLKMHIDTATSAAQAIEMIHHLKYDLIFMDHMMPEVDGVEATHIIRRLVPNYNDVPIIALTANAVGGVREMFIKEGMNDFIAKPIDIKDTLSKLRKWLPHEKIIYVEKSKAQEGSDPNGGSLYSSILEIKELNTKNALSLLGTEKLYYSVMKEYFEAIDKKYKSIKDHKEAKSWHDYTIEVHALKSTSRQIGAEHLADLAAEMEKAGNDGNVALINEKTDEMLSEYLKIKNILAPYFPSSAENVREHTALPEEIFSFLERMNTALDDFDTLNIDAIVEEMSKCKYEDEDADLFEKLKEAAEESDIDGCRKICLEWSKALMNPRSDEDKIIKMLDALQEALDEFDTLAIDEVVEKISHLNIAQSWKDHFDRLCAAAESSDIDKCAEASAEWRKAIAASGNENTV